MTKDFQDKVVQQFVNCMYDVKTLRAWLASTAGHIRVSITAGEAETGLLVWAEYLEKQAANLNAFVALLDHPPTRKDPEPVVNVKPVDPSVN